ncbi:hypothetical protein CAPTEDRAFT_153736 [Capitella teleta]|uniref:Apoptosis inhibitor 5 n=1 Tax=Capitella teleta TaxID=283909 RepID=R7UGE5_CAPTE|nr:hypothetical protein CAPTEDRAFT_153736 [Capitella teleta]|eukprot:ELU05589.1 hypothetical protein CAPTEDRAFT_153736 [Capitella teleta]
MAASIEELYKRFGVLADAKEDAGKHEDEFKFILKAVKGDANEKRLASQFIARFFKHFPSLSEQSLDAMFDLCEDEDVNIRKQAIKDLPTILKDAVELLPRVADVLTQLLQTDDPNEISLVHMSLLNLMKINIKDALHGLFGQILQGDELVRERAIKFLSAKLKVLPEEMLTKEVEAYIVTESKKILQDVTGGEFLAFINLLSGLKSMQTMLGRQGLLEIITEQADLDSPFEAADNDCVDRIMQCVKQAMPLFSKNVHSNKFLVYMSDQVLPNLSNVANQEDKVEENGSSEQVDAHLEILKLTAEMSTYCGPMENMDAHLGKVFDKLLEYMPLPPEGTIEEEDKDAEPKLQFSYVECLLYTFHQMGRHAPTFLTDESHAERLKDFKIRLQYFARGVQVYIRQLKTALQGKSGDALKTPENKIKVVALKITSNINTLIKDLFHQPPSYKSVVGLSFRPIAAKQSASTEFVGQKRSNYKPVSFDSEPAKKAFKGPREIYAPPSGKFSEKAGTFTPGGRGRGGFRGRGGRGGRGGFKRQW